MIAEGEGGGETGRLSYGGGEFQPGVSNIKYSCSCLGNRDIDISNFLN